MNFSKKNLGLLGLYFIANKIVDPITPYLKEKYRFRKGMKLAE